MQRIVGKLLQVISESIIDVEEGEIALTISSSPLFGDVSFGVFPVVEKLGFNIQGSNETKSEARRRIKDKQAELAKEIAALIQPDETIFAVTATGPYVNFKVQPAVLIDMALAAINPQTWSAGSSRPVTMISMSAL